MKQTTKTPLEKLVLLVLADCHNQASGKCFPSLTFICERSMCSRQGAVNALHSLETQGLISARRTAGKSTYYELHTGQLSRPVGRSKTSQHSVPVNSVDPSTQLTALVNSVDSTSQLSRPEPGNNQEVTRNTKRENPAKPDLSPCPQQAIVDLYHETLPSLQRHTQWNTTRQANLRSRWRESCKRQSLDWWKGFFEFVGESDFLMGRVNGRDGKPPFQADLEWLIRPANFAKVVEGKYHR